MGKFDSRPCPRCGDEAKDSMESSVKKAKQSTKAEKSKAMRGRGREGAEDAGGGQGDDRKDDDDDATVCKWRQRSTEGVCERGFKRRTTIHVIFDHANSGGGGRLRSKSKRIVSVGQTDVGERGQSTTEDESESLSTPPQAGPLKSLNAADFLAAAIRSKCGKGDKEDGRRSARFTGEGPTAGRLEEVDDSMVLLLGLAGAAVPAANPVAQARDSAGQGKLVLALGPRNRQAAAS
ncbi:hypothetical protein C4D60_Mb07t24930 [Musa balbisiana]|uniref:Uncharacterized protein n=1 Tax=Musa balbisiana TaxID=52838 RepID=A0A4S8JI18_MUSBA|nr:hypothetical protein C4D60_Mb07t24930 [Musa balbisiana]